MNNTNFTSIYCLAVGLVVSGLCLRFGGEQFLIDFYRKNYNDGPPNNLLSGVKYTGVGIYVLGWLVAAVCISIKHKGNKILRNSIFTAIIISVVWVVFEFKEVNFSSQPKLPLIACSVLLSSLIALISLKYKLKDIILIVVASILIVFAEFFILPYQRENNICDGIGLPLIIFGWFLFFHVFDKEEIPTNLIHGLEMGHVLHCSS